MLRSMAQAKHGICRVREGNGRRLVPALRGKQRRRGQAFEVVLAIPILLLATLATIEIGILFLVQQTVTTAAGDGVREAAKVGATTSSIVSEVERDLAVNNVKAPDYFIRIEYGVAPPTNVGDGSLLLSPPAGPASLSSTQVRVTVCVRPTNAHNQPVPNWLSTLGCTLQNWAFEVSALAYLE